MVAGSGVRELMDIFPFFKINYANFVIIILFA